MARAAAPRSSLRADARTKILDCERRALEPQHLADAVARDPLRFARDHGGDRDDRILVALLGALMAFGNVDVINKKLGELLGLLGARPAARVRASTRAELRSKLRGFVHRTFRGEHVADLLFAIGQDLRAGRGVVGRLEEAYGATGDLPGALSEWVTSLRAVAWKDGAKRAQKHLLPDPQGASASKRLMLFLRWVVRRGPPDLALVETIPPSALVIPVDVHILRIAQDLGLTRRTTANWKTAVEITKALSEIDADDPVRFDFPLCHQGMDRSRERAASKASLNPPRRPRNGAV